MRGACLCVSMCVRATTPISMAWRALSTRAMYRYGIAAVANHCDKKKEKSVQKVSVAE